MRKIRILVAHEGYPDGKTRRAFARDEEPSVPDDYAALLVERKSPPLASYVDKTGAQRKKDTTA